MSPRILVTGATGHIGSELVQQLRTRAADFAVLRSPSGRAPEGVASVEGDLNDPQSLRRAFAGFDTLFLLLPLVPHKRALAEHAVQAARDAGVRHIVRSSGAGADATSPVAIARLQGEIDALVQASGLNWTLLRPSFFMQNWVNLHLDQLKAGAYHAPNGDGAIGVIDVRDIAESAAVVLCNPQAHQGQVYTLTGGEALSTAQQLKAISEVVGREIRYVDVPESATRQAMEGMGMHPALVDWLMSLHHVVKQGWAAELTDDVRRLTGHAPRRFVDFVAEQAAVLRR